MCDRLSAPMQRISMRPRDAHCMSACVRAALITGLTMMSFPPKESGEAEGPLRKAVSVCPGAQHGAALRIPPQLLLPMDQLEAARLLSQQTPAFPISRTHSERERSPSPWSNVHRTLTQSYSRPHNTLPPWRLHSISLSFYFYLL